MKERPRRVGWGRPAVASPGPWTGPPGRPMIPVGPARSSRPIDRNAHTPRTTHPMTPAIRPIVAALALIGAGATPAPAAGFPWKSLAARPDDWYRGDEAARLAGNVLSHQSDRCDWPKNLDTSAAPYRGD